MAGRFNFWRRTHCSTTKTQREREREEETGGKMRRAEYAAAGRGTARQLQRTDGVSH